MPTSWFQPYVIEPSAPTVWRVGDRESRSAITCSGLPVALCPTGVDSGAPAWSNDAISITTGTFPALLPWCTSPWVSTRPSRLRSLTVAGALTISVVPLARVTVAAPDAMS